MSEEFGLDEPGGPVETIDLLVDAADDLQDRAVLRGRLAAQARPHRQTARGLGEIRGAGQGVACEGRNNRFDRLVGPLEFAVPLKGLAAHAARRWRRIVRKESKGCIGFANEHQPLGPYDRGNRFFVEGGIEQVAGDASGQRPPRRGGQVGVGPDAMEDAFVMPLVFGEEGGVDGALSGRGETG